MAGNSDNESRSWDVLIFGERILKTAKIGAFIWLGLSVLVLIIVSIATKFLIGLISMAGCIVEAGLWLFFWTCIAYHFIGLGQIAVNTDVPTTPSYTPSLNNTGFFDKKPEKAKNPSGSSRGAKVQTTGGATASPAGKTGGQDAGGRVFSAPTGNRADIINYTIPAGTTKIDNWAFSGWINLKSVSIPQGVVSVGNKAFSVCSALRSIYIPDGVQTIGSSAFHFCTNLTTVRLPASLTSVGKSAFLGCIALKTIRYAGTEEQWKAVSIGENNMRLNDVEIVFGAD